MDRDLAKTLGYFGHFEYKPSFEEMYTFFPVKIGQKRLKERLDSAPKHTLPKYIQKDYANAKYRNSIAKIQKISRYISLVSSFGQIELIGLSGSVSMMNAESGDDIDIFVISAPNRMWTVRFLLSVTAWCLGLKRGREEKKSRDKICLNLIFDGSALAVPTAKKGEYVAHEILQMIPLLERDGSYRRFLKANWWVNSHFPNIKIQTYVPYHVQTLKKHNVVQITKKNRSGSNVLGNLTERILRFVQEIYMNKPAGDELILERQLWFHPRDYRRIIEE